MAEQKSGIAMAAKWTLYVAVGPVLVGAVFAFGVWVWTLLT
jgi:hypothetical protein